jgi:hypothetical protein
MHERQLELLELLMTTIDAQLAAQTDVLTQILQAVQALSPAKPEDIQPVVDAVNAIGAKIDANAVTVNAIATKLPIDVASQAGTQNG